MKIRKQYGWMLVVLMTVAYFVHMGFYAGLSVFRLQWEGDFSISATTSAWCISIYALTYLLVSALAGNLCDRFGPKVPCIIGTVFGAGGMALGYAAKALVTLYVSCGICGIAAGVVFPTFLATISRWFIKKAAAATSLLFAGISASGIVLVPLNESLFHTIGWRSVMLCYGAAILVTTGITTVFIKRNPSEIGMLCDGRSEEDGPEEEGQIPTGIQEQGISPGEAVKTATFWLAMILYFGQGFGSNSFMSGLIPFCVFSGMDASSAVKIFSVFGIAGLAWRLAVPFVNKKLGNRKGLIASGLLTALTMAAFILANSPVYVLIVSLIFALASAVNTSLQAPFAAECLGTKYIGSFQGYFNMLVGLSGFAAPLLSSFSQEHFGSYALFFIVNAAVGLLYAISAWRMKKVY